MGIQHLTAAQFAKAEAIAIQCPLEGGSAVNGKQCAIQTFESGDVSLSTSNLLEGVYICQIKVRGKSPVALKLIVVH